MSHRGRGEHYGPARAALEVALTAACVGDWPGRLWGWVPGATRVQAVRHSLPLLPDGAPPLRVVFLSDLHVGPTTPPRLLDEAIDVVNTERPDLVLLGGDYVFLEATPARCQRLQALVGRIVCPTRLAVFGNHDLWTNHDALQRALEGGGAQVLVNEGVVLPAPWGRIGVAGLDEPWTGTPNAPRALRGLDSCGLILGLAHSPDGQPHFARHPSVRLILAGHTHGGQVALPGGVPLVVPGPMGQRHPHGLHRVGDQWLVVSRGLGGVEVPVRTFAPPDVLVIDLVSP